MTNVGTSASGEPAAGAARASRIHRSQSASSESSVSKPPTSRTRAASATTLEQPPGTAFRASRPVWSQGRCGRSCSISVASLTTAAALYAQAASEVRRHASTAFNLEGAHRSSSSRNATRFPRLPRGPDSVRPQHPGDPRCGRPEAGIGQTSELQRGLVRRGIVDNDHLEADTLLTKRTPKGAPGASSGYGSG